MQASADDHQPVLCSTRWRALIAPSTAEVGLIYWGDFPPFELQMLARILEEGITRGASHTLRWRWLKEPDQNDIKICSLAVYQQNIAQHAPLDVIHQIIHRTMPSVFIGPSVAWFARTVQAKNRRVAMHWEDAASREDLVGEVVLSEAIIETVGLFTTCAGGLAVVDLGLLMLNDLVSKGLTLQVMDALCIDRLREPNAHQRNATTSVLGALVPKLAQAIALMQANVEDPLSTDDIASHVALSRRQLERLFKQHLGLMPSRFYLDIRLQHARKLLRETRHSLLQIALMCGFASGSHFSTTYSTVYRSKK
jgi:transcriptional regulator GlxA family with amidase domain